MLAVVWTCRIEGEEERGEKGKGRRGVYTIAVD